MSGLPVLEQAAHKTNKVQVLFATGGYAGNGQPRQSITGIGFRPRFVFINAQDNVEYGLMQKTNLETTETNWYDYGAAGKYQDDHIISIDADGFTVGDGTGSENTCNVDGMNYTYVCFG